MDDGTVRRALRERVWAALRASGAGIGQVHGKIPAYVGAPEAAARLVLRDEWRRALVVKANPDRAQEDVRRLALAAGKLLYMAVPRIATLKPFHRLDPGSGLDPTQAARREEAAGAGTLVSLTEMRTVDLVICGSVAVNPAGVRLGKGAGYSDIEVGLLVDAGLVTDDTVIVAPVHDAQVLDEDLPEAPHDFRVDLVVTPTQVIVCPRVKQRSGIRWNDLTDQQRQSIPVLATRKGHPSP